MFWSKRLCSFYFHKDTEHFRYELRLIFWIFRHNMTKQPKLWVKKKKKKKNLRRKNAISFLFHKILEQVYMSCFIK